MDIRRQEVVDVPDDAKRKSSCTTRASPALAHGADEGYTVMNKQQSDIAASLGNDENSSAAAAASQSNTAVTSVATADDRQPVTNSHSGGVRSLKHRNDRLYKSGTGPADLQRAASLQDVTDSSGGVGRSLRLSSGKSENEVSSDVVHDDTASSTCCGVSSSSSACSTSSCDWLEVSCAAAAADTASEQSSLSPRMSHSCAQCSELQLVDSTRIVSSTAQFWEDLLLDSSNSATQCCARFSRHASEDNGNRFRRRDASSSRYSTVGAPCNSHSLDRVPCDNQCMHDMVTVPLTTANVLSRSESMHVNSDLEVCVCALVSSVTAYIVYLCFTSVWFHCFDTVGHQQGKPAWKICLHQFQSLL